MNRALLIGINKYPGAPLSGCVNDITDMANFLVKNCKFKMQEIRLLTDTRATTKEILARLKWLVTGLKKGDRVLFHYSGHGAQVATRDKKGEIDGKDEVICPVDFDWTDKHMIRDKEFAKIFSTVPKGVEFIWISDSCHSGDLSKDFPKTNFTDKTMLPPADMDWRIQTFKGQTKITADGLAKTASKLNVALISGCQSNQTSADATFNNRANGALTYFLLKELKKSNGLSESLVKVVKNVNKEMDANDFNQNPQLEGSKEVKNKGFMDVCQVKEFYSVN
ncbi:MAG: caspase family protein [Bacteroidales bacterium]|nr:caspase family protein [Bacteroidales bacterium]